MPPLLRKTDWRYIQGLLREHHSMGAGGCQCAEQKNGQHLQTYGYSASVGDTALSGYRLRSMCPRFQGPVTGSKDSIAGLLDNVNTM